MVTRFMQGLVFALIFGVCVNAQAAEKSLRVFVAASSQDAVKKIGDAFTKETGIVIKLNPASSGTLARQIEQGAQADVYISASLKWVKFLNEKKLLTEDKVILNNALVLVCAKDAKAPAIKFEKGFDFAAAFAGKLSIGDPAYVPAGKYAEGSLKSLGWYESVKTRFIKSKDVRAALRVVEVGGADLGIVYKTDAMKSGKVAVCGTFPPETHKPIAYPCGVVKGASADAKTFYDYLSSDTASTIFESYGFVIPAK